MKFIRSARVKEKVIDFASKIILLVLTAIFCLWMISGAKASEISEIIESILPNGSQGLEIKFSEKIDPSKIQVEFQRNFIQLSVRGLSAFPAKTKTLNNPMLDKVFTYQYQPDLARARILLKDSAATIKKFSNYEITDSGIKFSFNSPASYSAPVISEVSKQFPKVKTDILKTTASSSSTKPEMQSDIEEDKIVRQIIQEAKQGKNESDEKSLAPAVAVKKETITTSSSLEHSENLPVFSHESSSSLQGTSVSKNKEASLSKVLASLLMVLGLIAAGTLAFRRFSGGKGIGFQKNPKLIEIISSQSMGPKRSIAIVKVVDKFLVIGMCGDGMNLLATLDDSARIEKYIDDVTNSGFSFTNTFEQALGMDKAPEEQISQTIHTKANEGIRSLIKKRIEGFKPL